MSRQLRIKLLGEEARYHIVSRTVGREFLLGSEEKDKLFDIIQYYSNLYFVDVINYSIMSNHFHLFVKFKRTIIYDRSEIIRRIKVYRREPELILSEKEIDRYMEKFSDISEYVKDIKQKFARWYNDKYERWGHFWGERFRSVIFESGVNVLRCSVYIDLNPVRAGLVDSPEDYKWCGAFYRYILGNPYDFLTFDDMFEDEVCESDLYRELLRQKAGVAVIMRRIVKNEKELRSSAYTKGGAVGSASFMQYVFVKNERAFSKRKTRGKPPIFLCEDQYVVLKFVH